jgi:hypothetical protein
VWHGTGERRMGSDHVARGVARLDVLARTASARWEVRARIDARPVLVGTVAAFTDVGVVADGALLYHHLVGASTVVSIGVEAHGAYWHDPSTAVGSFESAVSSRTFVVAGIVEVRHESAR